MPNLSVSVSSLLSALNMGGLAAASTPQDKAENAGTDIFSSLIGIGKDAPKTTESAEVEVQPRERVQPKLDAKNDESVRPRRSDEDEPQPVAAHVEGQREQVQPRAKVQERDEVAPVRADAPKAQVAKPDAAEKTTDTAAPVRDVQQAKTAGVKSAEVEVAPAQGEEVVAEGDALADKLDAKLSEVSQILLSILQVYGGAEAASVDAQAALPVAADNVAVSAEMPKGQVMDLLKQIGQTLQQLQQLIKAGGDEVSAAQLPQVSDAAQGAVQGAKASNVDAFVQLSSALQASVAKLTQLVQQQGDNGEVIAPSLAALAPVDDAVLPSPAEIKSVLKSAIAQVREGLSALRTDNEQFFRDAGVLPEQLPKEAQTQTLAQQVEALRAAAAQNMVGRSTKKEADVKDAPAAPAVQALAASAVIPQQSGAAQVQPQAAVVVQAAAASSDSSSFNSDTSGGKGQGQSAGPLSASAAELKAPDAAAKSDFAKALDRARTPVMEQVMVQIKKVVNDGSSRITIHLDPVELGKLDIRIHVGADGKTGMVITADNRSTMEMLQRDAQNLARALNDAGLQADSGSLSFNLRGDQGQQGGQDRSQAASSYRRGQPEDEMDVTLDAITRSYTVTLADGLDIKI